MAKNAQKMVFWLIFAKTATPICRKTTKIDNFTQNSGRDIEEKGQNCKNMAKKAKKERISPNQGNKQGQKVPKK